MDEKINLNALTRYSEEFASKISGLFFATKEKISGPEILGLCEIRQVNLFVIRELLYRWRAENEKLQSPYFNYQAKAVIEALTEFQNTLSNNILISRADFHPLLVTAVQRTLSVVLSPYDFYAEALDRQGHQLLDVANLRNDIRYLKINRAPLEKLAQKLEDKKLTSVQRNEAFALLDSILEEVGFHPEDIDGYLEQFSKTLPLEIENLYDAKPGQLFPAESKPIPDVRPPEQLVVKPVSEKKVASPVNEQKSQRPSLDKISRIKDSLTINQKFMFTKILFHGDFEIFSQAIERLDTLDNFAQAEKYLQSTYPEWDMESVEYLEFREMLERRFS